MGIHDRSCVPVWQETIVQLILGVMGIYFPASSQNLSGIVLNVCVCPFKTSLFCLVVLPQGNIYAITEEFWVTFFLNLGYPLPPSNQTPSHSLSLSLSLFVLYCKLVCLFCMTNTCESHNKSQVRAPWRNIFHTLFIGTELSRYWHKAVTCEVKIMKK